jgi:hypothetical protein
MTVSELVGSAVWSMAVHQSAKLPVAPVAARHGLFAPRRQTVTATAGFVARNPLAYMPRLVTALFTLGACLRATSIIAGDACPGRRMIGCGWRR